MNDKINIRVFLKPPKGRKIEIKGKIAWEVLEAIKELLEEQESPRMGPIQICFSFPEEFDLTEAVALALAHGHSTKQEIKEYIERHIQHCSTL